MLVSNPDLINSCLVCRCPNQDGDHEPLYEPPPVESLLAQQQVTPRLTYAGILYENLFGKISPDTYEYYPRFLCNSCDLQMKLFRKLRDRAQKTKKYLSKLYDDDFLAAREEQKIDIDVEELVEEDRQMTDIVQQNNQIDQPVTPRCVGEVNAATAIGDTVYIIPDAIQAGNFELIDGSAEKNTIITEAEGIPHYAEIDKSDYILEIYKVLEDNSQTAASETIESQGNDIALDKLEFRGESDSQLGFSDEQYVDIDSYVTSDKTDDDYRPTKRRKVSIGDNVTVYTCSECSEIFTCAKEFKRHSTYIHAQTYSCQICSAVLKTSRTLALHMKIHSDTPDFKCEICQRTFTQKPHYQYHMNRHNNIRNFKCDECDKCFLTKSDLKIHMRQHTGDRPYVCEICGKGYRISEHLKSHAIKHTDQVFPCELCSQTFATPKTLRQHVTTIHASEPKFKCEFCSKPFRRKHHLQYHMKLHPKNILDDPNYDIVDDSEMGENNCDEFIGLVDSCADEQLDDVEEENQENGMQDPGFVALN